MTVSTFLQLLLDAPELNIERQRQLAGFSTTAGEGPRFGQSVQDQPTTRANYRFQVTDHNEAQAFLGVWALSLGGTLPIIWEDESGTLRTWYIRNAEATVTYRNGRFAPFTVELEEVIQ
jgi:hypothetical protein